MVVNQDFLVLGTGQTGHEHTPCFKEFKKQETDTVDARVEVYKKKGWQLCIGVIVWLVLSWVTDLSLLMEEVEIETFFKATWITGESGRLKQHDQLLKLYAEEPGTLPTGGETASRKRGRATWHELSVQGCTRRAGERVCGARTSPVPEHVQPREAERFIHNTLHLALHWLWLCIRPVTMRESRAASPAGHSPAPQTRAGQGQGPSPAAAWPVLEREAEVSVGTMADQGLRVKNRLLDKCQ